MLTLHASGVICDYIITIIWGYNIKKPNKRLPHVFIAPVLNVQYIIERVSIVQWCIMLMSIIQTWKWRLFLLRLDYHYPMG